MYTGIVQGSHKIISINRQQGLNTLGVQLPDVFLKDLAIGASVAIDGVCLTVTVIEGNMVSFDVMKETLAVTTLGEVVESDLVNIERSAKQGAEVGGHQISGHIDGMAEIINIEEPENNHFVSYRVLSKHAKYIFPKGFVAINGCSLTVAEINKAEGVFKVCYIPETLRVTTHGEKTVGDRVNYEIDRQTQVIVDTVESYLKDNPPVK